MVVIQVQFTSNGAGLSVMLRQYIGRLHVGLGCYQGQRGALSADQVIGATRWNQLSVIVTEIV